LAQATTGRGGLRAAGTNPDRRRTRASCALVPINLAAAAGDERLAQVAALLAALD